MDAFVSRIGQTPLPDRKFTTWQRGFFPLLFAVKVVTTLPFFNSSKDAASPESEQNGEGRDTPFHNAVLPSKIL